MVDHDNCYLDYDHNQEMSCYFNHPEGEYCLLDKCTYCDKYKCKCYDE